MNRFNVGDKIVCINNNFSLFNSLTLHKTYIITNIQKSFLEIFDDNNDNVIYPIDRFVTLKEFRLLKLKQTYE